MFDAPPEAFGSYRVLDAIAGGRFGPVYRARDAASGELVAIKVFNQGLTGERAAALAEALDRLCRAPLDHPVIVPRLLAGARGHRAWVAEPWFEALPLDHVMRTGGAQPLGDVLLRITQVAGALDFAAAAGICHGALHPRDILVSDDRTRLTGIGVLQALGEAGLDVPMTGAYVSPQRAAGEPPTPADDLFALAAITCELVSGTPVPDRAELRGAMTRLTGVDHGRFLDLLEGALSPEARDRPPTALAFAGALQQVCSEAPPVPVPDVTPEARRSVAPEVRPSAPADAHLGRESDAIARDAPARPAADDLPLRTPEVSELRWEAEPEPAVMEPAPVLPLAFTSPIEDLAPAFQARGEAADSTSSYWFPVAAALAIGILAGFAGGFVVGQRDVTPAPLSAERIIPRSQRGSSADEIPAPTAGRELTDADVPAVRDRDTAQAVTEEVIEPGTRNTEPRTGNPESGTGNLESRTPNRAQNPDQDPGTRNQEAGTAAQRAAAALEVDSRPRGASVFVDGRLVGRTPLVLDDVRPGAHAVRIDLVGHRRWVTSVDVAPGTRRRVAASLER